MLFLKAVESILRQVSSNEDGLTKMWHACHLMVCKITGECNEISLSTAVLNSNDF